MDKPNLKRYRQESQNWEEIQETGCGRIEMAGDFTVIVDSYIRIWKRLKDDDILWAKLRSDREISLMNLAQQRVLVSSGA